MSDKTASRISRRIRELRAERGLTLQEVADSAGFSKALLSKIETGIVTPPIPTLEKISEVLDVPIAELFMLPSDEEDQVFFPRRKRQRIQGPLSSDHLSYDLLARGRRRLDMRPVLVSVDGKSYKFKLTEHGGQHFIYMLEGEMEYVVGENTYQVAPEDCLYFDARLQHGPKLKKNQKARYIVVFSDH